MPWMEVNTVTLRKEFVFLATKTDTNKRELCRRFGISPKTGYKWLHRYHKDGLSSLSDQSRRPHHSPKQTVPDIEHEILKIRDQHPAWGGRKINTRLSVLGCQEVPAPSTITNILRRHGRLDPKESDKHKAFQSFEYKSPNQLWQMDFKGHFALLSQSRCHPLTVLDDHSRYSLGLVACVNEKGKTVQVCLESIFRRYGLPHRMLMDNGSPWGSDKEHPYTPLTVWMMRLGIRVIHSRPYHPQTQGKDERFHRTLKDEVLRYESFEDHKRCQLRFDTWRYTYNHERPHESLGMAVPASRYHPSPRSFPETLAPIEYAPEYDVRKVQQGGWISYQGRNYKISKAFTGYPVGLRSGDTDGIVDVIFCNQTITQIDLHSHDIHV